MNKSPGQDIKFKFNVPNMLTSIRILLAIAVVTLIALGSKTQISTAGILLIVAAVTDFFDGNLARRLKQTSLFGSLFDIVADEILFMPTLVLAVIAGLFSRAGDYMPLNPGV